MVHAHYAAHLLASPIKGWRLFREPYIKIGGGVVALAGVFSAARLIVKRLDEMLSGCLH